MGFNDRLEVEVKVIREIESNSIFFGLCNYIHSSFIQKTREM